ncbi:MAG TPA: YciK family oxidoreductase [Hyphomicrobiales bacterium]|nr:YciK family oxidoreductase [Hyphomicrobiales bacterium]
MFTYTPTPDFLRDRIILVTGAGSGLGRAAALDYARHGATLLLLGRDEAKLDAVYDAIEAEGGTEPAIFVMDLERAGENDYFELANLIHQEFGHLDGLLHSAGVFAPILPLEHHTLESWQRLLQVNLTAGFALTRACLPLLRAGQNASVIFTSSTAGRELRAYWGGYAIAKHAVENLAQMFHLELENTSAIRVNTLNPGPCATALRRVGFPAEDPSTLPRPEALMAPYLYLMGDDSLHERGKQFSAQ